MKGAMINMKRKKVLLPIIMIFMSLLIGINSNIVYAANVGVDISNSASSRYLATGAGKDIDHSAVKYYVDGEQAYCIQAGIAIRSSYTYTEQGPLTDARFSWIIYNIGDQDLKQAAIWQLAGYVGYGSYVTNKDQAVDDAINSATDAINNQHDAASAGTSVDPGEFYYDSNLNAFVSPTVHIWNSFGTWLNGATGNSYLMDGWGNNCGTSVGSGDYRIVVPVDGINGVMDISVGVRGEGYRQVYDWPMIYGDGNSGHQLVIKPRMKDTWGNDTTSASIHLNPLGNLVIEQKDSYGTYRQGATFHVTGPGGTWDITTGDDGKAYLNNILIGSYQITETQAPNNMKNEEENRTNYVNVSSGQTVTYTRTNGYPTGSVRLGKYDVDHRNSTLGNATLKGAKYNLCAAEDIYEGATLRYSNGQVIREVVTDEYGNTPAITGLPIGNYYYIETQASTGFLQNSARVPVSVNYEGQYTYVIGESYVETAEKPSYSNLKIHKRLSATDYDNEIDLSGVQFKVTLKSDSSQVYYTNVSGADGICVLNNLPYGTYIVSESKLNDAGYKIADFEVFCGENGKTYEYTKVDESKKMKIEVNKEILLHEGEATDAVVSGAVFTVYRDAACTNKVCEIGPTNENGYAISGTMRTGTYYMKETTFPTGIDPDATIPGENVTYRNKVYTISENNKTQGNDIIISPITIQNEPNRNDIEIIKDLGETSNTSQFPLDKCKFTATLVSSIGTDHEFSRECTAETDVNGHCIIEDLPYGTYIVEETTVSPISLKCADFTVFVEKDRKVRANPYEPKDGTFAKTTLGETIGTTKEYSTSYNWLDNNGHIVDVPKVMKIKMRKVDANRTDAESPDYTQGDAVLKGAIYQIYRYDPQTDDYTEYVYDITVDHKDSEGYWCAESDELLVGKYMVKEKIKYSETEEGVTYNYSYAEGYLSDPEIYYFEQQPDLQDVRLTYQYDTSKEEVIRGIVRVIKYDNRLESTDEVASKGAILRLVLDSSVEEGHPLKDAKIYYDVKIDQYGYGEFVDTNDDMHETSVKTCYGEGYYPYTIPYGKYTIIEVKESDAEEHTSFFIQPEDVTIERQVQKEYRIEADEPVEMYIKIQKRDKDTGAKVELSGAKYKVWNVEKQEFVSQITYPSGKYIDEFTTAEDGMLTLPHKLEAGDYIIYETQAPEGYYLEDSLRLPENEEDIGKKGGKYVTINKAAMGVEEDTPYNKKDLFYTVDMSDTPLKGNLVIEKKGERLTGVLIETTKYGEKYTPKYTMQGLEGVTYEIRAAEDIKSPDGNVTYVTAGTLVDTITTGEDGIAKTKDLYLGEYTIKEVVTPKGYLTDENIPNVTLENKNQYVKSETTNKELSDVRQKLELTFEKVFEDVNYANGETLEKKAVFGVYTKESIKDHKNKVVIGKDQLVDLIEVNDNNFVTSTIDLPEGKYYVKELDVTFPYTLSVEKRDFDLKYTNHKDEFVVSQGELLKNKYEKGSISLFKISTSQIEDLVLNGKEIETEGLDAQLTEMLERFKSMTESEIREYIEANDIKIIPGAKYAIYTDKECQKPLYIKDETTDKFVKAEVVTDESGMIKLEGLPLGEYFLVEVEAPKGYELSKEVVSFKLTNEDKNSMIYRAIAERPLVGGLITKTDIFTSEVVPNCVFEIADEDGKVLMHSITDEEGKAYIVTDMFENGKTYTYTEIEAPEIYELNTEPHEFLAEFDEEGNWTAEPIKVENIRKKSTVTITKLDMVDSTPIPNCKFELKSLETDFKVEGVTDENGIYVFENIPYGKYTYTELEAPEEYLIDTTPHEITIDAEDIKIVVKDERAPETGDIAVVSMIALAMVSACGIVITLKKKYVK